MSLQKSNNLVSLLQVHGPPNLSKPSTAKIQCIHEQHTIQAVPDMLNYFLDLLSQSYLCLYISCVFLKIEKAHIYFERSKALSQRGAWLFSGMLTYNASQKCLSSFCSKQNQQTSREKSFVHRQLLRSYLGYTYFGIQCAKILKTHEKIFFDSFFFNWRVRGGVAEPFNKLQVIQQFLDIQSTFPFQFQRLQVQ